MVSKWPSGAHLSHPGAFLGCKVYFKVPFGGHFYSFGSPWWPLGSFWELFRHMFLFGRSWELKIVTVWEGPFWWHHFLRRFWIDIWGLGETKHLHNMHAWGSAKIMFRLCLILDHFRYHLGGHVGAQNAPQILLWLTLGTQCRHLGALLGGHFFGAFLEWNLESEDTPKGRGACLRHHIKMTVFPPLPPRIPASS